MDLEAAKLALQFFAGIGLPVASAIYTWVATRDKDNTQYIQAVEQTLGKQLGEHAGRMSRLETQMQYMPTPERISQLQSDIRSVQAGQEGMQREMTSMRQATNRIETYLLKV
ncbi:DUF2730 family protein [Variovorax sp.]|uniref:DUF2730 family protein n=1 Tax=Variovorax sp. TaxID=1871043 RepID=UPI003BA865A6